MWSSVMRWIGFREEVGPWFVSELWLPPDVPCYAAQHQPHLALIRFSSEDSGVALRTTKEFFKM